jgi:hypothetical protein
MQLEKSDVDARRHATLRVPRRLSLAEAVTVTGDTVSNSSALQFLTKIGDWPVLPNVGSAA